MKLSIPITLLTTIAISLQASDYHTIDHMLYALILYKNGAYSTDIDQHITAFVNDGVNPNSCPKYIPASAPFTPTYMQLATQFSIQSGRFDALTALLKNGGNPHQKDSIGASPYKQAELFAIEHPSAETVLSLFDTYNIAR